MSEIIDIVVAFKENKSAGFHNISLSIMKNTIIILARPLANILNLSLSCGIFPGALKIANAKVA